MRRIAATIATVLKAPKLHFCSLGASVYSMKKCANSFGVSVQNARCYCLKKENLLKWITLFLEKTKLTYDKMLYALSINC